MIRRAVIRAHHRDAALPAFLAQRLRECGRRMAAADDNAMAVGIAHHLHPLAVRLPVRTTERHFRGGVGASQ